ncbi:MAG: amidase [Acidimicrobiia bacterium]
MNDPDSWLDATAQAEMVAAGDVSPTELVDAAIARIEALNPALNAVIHERFERGRSDARTASVHDGTPNGPLHGVPFLVKDAVCHTAGDPFHCGMRLLKRLQWTETDDTWLAARFRAAGVVFVGKTNTPELATSVTTEPIAYGATHNPWDLTRSPGGSSGGAAAAVASGMVAIAHGNDMGGSIRFPASMCGIVGLKPTRARTTLGPDFGEYWGPLTHEHVLTRSVRDTALVLDAVAGAGPGDPYTAPPPTGPFGAEIATPPGSLRVGLRTRRRDGTDSAPDCIRAVEQTGQLLESLGHHVEHVDLPALDDPIDGAFGTVMTVAVARDLARWAARTGVTLTADDVEPGNLFLAEVGAAVTGVEYAGAIEQMQTWSRRVAAWWEHHDILVTPTSPEPPVRLGVLAPTNPDPLVGAHMASLVTFAIPFDVTGQPAISLPLHWTDDGLPIGVQLVAAYGREDVLLRISAQLEHASPWKDRHPPVRT